MQTGNTDYIDLQTLQSVAKACLEDCFRERLWVKAEIASVKLPSARSQHCYLDLCQTVEGRVVAQSRAIIWSYVASSLIPAFEEQTGMSLKPGITVLFNVSVNFSELYGYSLIVNDIDSSFTTGEWYLKRQKTIKRLEEENLMDRQRQLSLDILPRELAVISASTAAGYGDFCKHLTENQYGYAFSIDLYEASMQGEAAPKSISESISQAVSSKKHYSAILILRGGGSQMDLDCYDDYELASAIATCPIPVITAIGHDRDHHIADMVAWDNVKTPTALADLFIDKIAVQERRIDDLNLMIRRSLSNRVASILMKVELLYGRIKSADPRAIISRGYCLVADEKGRVLKNVSSRKKGDKVNLMMSDGSLDCTVDEVRKK